MFSETQQFKQKWILLIVSLITAICWWAFLSQIVFGQPFGNNPGSDFLVWVIFTIFGLGLPWLLVSMKLVTEVHQDHISIRFPPFISRKIYHHDIKQFYLREYRPIREYGGLGIRWSPHAGSAYNVSGNIGLQLELINDKKVLIGTQKGEEFELALRKVVVSQ